MLQALLAGLRTFLLLPLRLTLRILRGFLAAIGLTVQNFRFSLCLMRRAETNNAHTCYRYEHCRAVS